MPFFYDETNIEWPEDGSEPSPPRTDQFVYMTVAEYAGEPTAAPAAARFSSLPFDAADEQELPSVEPATPMQVERRGILARLFGWGRAEDTPLQRDKSIQDSMRRQMLEQRKRMQQLFSVTIPALRSLGVRRVYCRYDGGNDEGFAWLDHFQTEAGDRIDTENVLKRLYESGLHDKLRVVGFKDHMRGNSIDQKMSDIRTIICGWLPNDWSWILMGNFGTGEYSMYGAFTVDLDECSVTDDPNAEPVVQNIAIAS